MVPGTLTTANIRRDRPDKGGPPLRSEEQPGSVIDLFLRDLPDEYRVDCFEVNAVNYGAPQLRERVLMFGNRLGIAVDFPPPTHGPVTAEVAGNGHVGLLPLRTPGDALQELEQPGDVILDFSPRKKRYLALVPPGGNWRALPETVARESMGRAYLAKGGRSGWVRLSLDLPCPTLLALPNHAGTALCHPTEVRALTVREYARTQEFPEDWQFCGTAQQQYEQAGNAVPIRLGEVAGSVVADALDSGVPGGPVRASGLPKFRRACIRSHVRTRYWYRAGVTFQWVDRADNGHARYGVAHSEAAPEPAATGGRNGRARLL